MRTIISQVLGGIGIFLLGMILMEDGLKSLAGESLKRILKNFTKNKIMGIFSGALVTALVQSSTATTLTTIGFVSAGLLTLYQSIGIIIGSNLGTTSTAWIVALLGFKFSITKVALPLVGVGVLINLLAWNHWKQVGRILSGFGLIFIGIDFLQVGMEGYSQWIDFSGFASDTWLVKIALVFIGIMMTIVLQSSSAAIATTLAAVYAGSIDFAQAAPLVIGQNIGTTFTAFLAAIGGTLVAKRAALSHIIFNVVTGAVAFLMLPIFVNTLARFSFSAEVDIAIFHTLFNLLGILVFYPILKKYAGWIQKVLPDKGDNLTKNLDDSVAQIPEVALEAAERTMMDLGTIVMGSIYAMIKNPDKNRFTRQERVRLTQVEEALPKINDFLVAVETSDRKNELAKRKVKLIHAVDHLGNLLHVFQKLQLLSSRTGSTTFDEALKAIDKKILEISNDFGDYTMDSGLVDEYAKQALAMAELRKVKRAELLEKIALGEIDTVRGDKMIQKMISFDSLFYYLHHFLINLEA